MLSSAFLHEPTTAQRRKVISLMLRSQDVPELRSELHPAFLHSVPAYNRALASIIVPGILEVKDT